MFDSIKEAKIALAPVMQGASPDTARNVEALLQVLEIAEAAESKSDVLSQVEITDIGEQGLALIDDLTFKLASQQREAERQQVEQVSLVIAQWVITHRGDLTNIQSVVNSLAQLSNTISDPTQLTQLVTFMGLVAQACSEAIKRDLDNANPARPWRVLNMNRGITATRSHDLDLMRATFPELIAAIPMDAPDFFKEGMAEMVRLNYPESVQELIKEFYTRSTKPVAH